MEEQFVNYGAIVVKFWLHIDKDEQLKRFQKRESVHYKKWKITPEDYRNREKWNDYEAAVNEMLIRTSTSYAPWTVIEANSKHFARLKTIRAVIEAIEKILFTYG
jgi:polyphosphate kinase 2 (PPK2 family)